jgi:mannose-6-phosphate isomerase
VPRDSAERNYSDANHKPELAYALTDFEAFCGFRPEQQTAELFDAVGVPELKGYASLLTGSDGLRATFTTLLTLSGPTRARLIEACLEGCRRLAEDGGVWAGPAAASVRAAQDFPDDIGSVLSLMLNYVRLAPGEAIFLGAGNVHAYLRGTCVEVLANSDNVLRCGLTPKHVDVPELLRIADFTALSEPRWTPSEIAAGHRRFAGPVADFALSVHQLSETPVTLEPAAPHLVLSGGGRVEVAVGAESRLLIGWQAVFVGADQSGDCTLSGSGTAFVVATNLQRPATEL